MCIMYMMPGPSFDGKFNTTHTPNSSSCFTFVLESCSTTLGLVQLLRCSEYVTDTIIPVLCPATG
jgi:hypothetical protein